MIQKLSHRVDSLSARRTASNNDAFSALRDRRRFVYEVRQIVFLNFLLNRSKQNEFCTVRLLMDVQREPGTEV
jgi:hypothetical protein